MSALGDAALDYASRGYRVFPCVPGEKRPLTEHGFLDATTDEQQIREWWGKWPNANIGLNTEGLLVVDVDPRNGGTDDWAIGHTVEQPPKVATGGSGYHYWFRTSADAPLLRKSIGSGIDIRSTGGYVLVPPSVTEQEYRWVNEYRDPPPAPDWLIEKCRKPEYKPKQIILGDSNQFDDRPGSVFNRTATWEEILEPHGWTVVDEEGDEQYWRRPGKDNGSHSATTNYAGTNLLYVFSSAAEPFEADTAYSPFSAYTLLNYNGNYSEAAKSLMVQPVVAETITEETYSFEPAFPAGHFVTDYINYAQLQTDAPREYHEASGLCALAVASSASRGHLAPYPDGLSTNLFIVLVGSTTRSRKSTSQRIAQSMVKQVSPFSILPNRATTEALIETMSQHSGIPTLWTPDEFGVQLAEIYRRDFMNGLEEMLLTLYSGDDYSYRRVRKNTVDDGVVTVRNPHLNILAAATPESLMRAGNTALESGLLPRFAVVYPKVLPQPRPAAPADTNLESLREALISRLRAIQTYSKGVERVTFSTASLASLNAAEGILVGMGVHTARLPTMLFKVAMLSALADMRSEVTEADANSAVQVVMRWADGVNNLRPLLSMRSSDVDFERSVQTAKEVFQRLAVDGQVNRALVARELRLSSDTLARVERTLVERAEIKSEQGYWKC